ncbi:unknown [Clostridium sp. CAG:448]|nr:unknown [Clostridium sp. CAG:448]
MGISQTSPLRNTRQNCLPHASESRRNAASEPYSESVEINVARNTETAIPPVSNQLAFRNKKSTLTANAHKRILMTGSPRFARNLAPKLFPLCARNPLSPCAARDAATSLSVSPLCRSPRENPLTPFLSPIPFICLPPLSDFIAIYEKQRADMLCVSAYRQKAHPPKEILLSLAGVLPVTQNAPKQLSYSFFLLLPRPQSQWQDL